MIAALRKSLTYVLKGLILAYRYGLSPLFPPSCRFTPTCSEYALEAIEVHGPLRGAYLAARRLARCHPIKLLGGSSGFDPVPRPSSAANCACDGPGKSLHDARGTPMHEKF